MKYSLLLILTVLLFGCDNNDSSITLPEGSTMYYPPSDTNEWLSISPNEAGWNTSFINELLTFLEDNNTRAFIMLKDGKIVVEEYFGNNLSGTGPFGQNSQWYWASAGKTLTATLTGIAQQEGQLNIADPTSVYLGKGWTSLAADKEDLITVRDQLTMTTGFDYEVANLNCTLPSCLTYKRDAGQQWFYHNAPYTLLEKVIENATGTDYNAYTDQKLEAVTGMRGQWIKQDFNNVYWSTARDMARFGLFILNKGEWDGTKVLLDDAYYDQMVNTSQILNPSYGYLWWLNGKGSIVFPGLPDAFNTSLSENAPSDLFAGLGKDGQFVEVIPSRNLVVVRMGEAPDGSLVPIAFHDEMWKKINQVYQ